MHLFSSSSISYELNSDVDYDFQTTCFPAYSGENSKGWCTIRRSGVDDNEQPQADSGWGFCSTDPSQEDCNGYISSIKDSTPYEVTFFDKEHCFEQLKTNLEYEQPEAVNDTLRAVANESGTFCTGQIFKHSFENLKGMGKLSKIMQRVTRQSFRNFPFIKVLIVLS